MRWNLMLAVLLSLLLFASATAQSVIKILQFDKNTGIIDKGEDAGLGVGDIFDVNRYAGDFVYWIGRVEVIVVKPKASGVKMLAQAENATIQQGDVLELRKRDVEPVLEKPNPENKGTKKTDSLQQGKIAPVESGIAAAPSHRTRPVIFGFTSGLSRPFKNSSQAFGLNFSVPVKTTDGNTQAIDMTHAYATSVGLQAFCTLPLSNRFAVNLNYAYFPLNVKGAVESTLLNYGRKASASLMKISAALESRLYQRLHAGLGAGFFLPQVKINGRQPITISERHLGFAANVAHWLPLGPAVWLKSLLEYDIFLNDGPAIHYLTLQTGLSIGFGKH